LRVFMMHLATLLCIQREIEGFSAPFAFLFAIPYVLFASRPFPQATHQGDGWTLAKTIAKTHKRKPTRL